MRFALFAAGAALACSSPALATGGFECRAIGEAGPTLNIIVGHTIAARPVAVTLRDGGKTLSTTAERDPLVVGQSWIDGQHLWLDLVDADALRFEAKLRARFQPKLRGRPATGTLVRGGRTYRVRCVEA